MTTTNHNQEVAMYGVFTWEQDGMYLAHSAIHVCKSEKVAQRWADRRNAKDRSLNLVVRNVI